MLCNCGLIGGSRLRAIVCIRELIFNKFTLLSGLDHMQVIVHIQLNVGLHLETMNMDIET